MLGRSPAKGGVMAEDPTLERLDDQIAWYDRKATSNQRMYKTGKTIVIVAAALIPFVSGLPWAQPWHMGALGVLIAVIEGLQQLNQYHANWTAFRATAEELKREKYLYLAKAGPYAGVADAHALLAERAEGAMSRETASWSAIQESLEKKSNGSASSIPVGGGDGDKVLVRPPPAS